MASAPLVGFVALPKLTQTEKNLLNVHQGCYKCRTFYAGRFLCTCTGEWPTLETCKKVTATGTLRVKAAFEARNAPVVAAVFSAGLDENIIDEDFVDSDEFDEYVSPSPLPPSPNTFGGSAVSTPLLLALLH